MGHNIETEKNDIQHNTGFQLPLEYMYQSKSIQNKDDIYCLPDQVLEDLEMKQDLSNNPYSRLFNKRLLSNEYLQTKQLNWSKYYTSNSSLIKRLRELYLEIGNRNETECCVDGFNKWCNFNDNGKLDRFCSKFSFFDMKQTRFLNDYPWVLQIMSTYNFVSPAFQLILPFLILLMPFFILTVIIRKPITFDFYKKILYVQLKNHAIGKIFTIFDNDTTVDTRIYAFIMFGFYLFSIYQNTQSCIRFYKNTNYICELLYNVRYILSTSSEHQTHIIDSLTKIIKNINNDEEQTTKTYFVKYKGFLEDKLRETQELYNLFESNHYKTFTKKTYFQVGKNQALLYKLYTKQEYKDTIQYCLENFIFEQNCISLNENKCLNIINSCKLYSSSPSHPSQDKQETTKPSKEQPTHIKDMYYPFFLETKETELVIPKDVIYNSYHQKQREKTRFITGPNASGKTTYIKTLMINMIFSQQIGMGFYKSAQIQPYDYYYSYLTIPDTSGRDSLFQAEARRCLEIIEDVSKYADKRHFAIFDELFSGTNAVEAVETARLYIHYMSQYRFTSFITTHFTELIDKCMNDKEYKDLYQAYKMNVEEVQLESGIDFIYLYTIMKGINNIQGAYKVLCDLHYPEDIIKKLSVSREK
jgi:hypothetical protein